MSQKWVLMLCQRIQSKLADSRNGTQSGPKIYIFDRFSTAKQIHVFDLPYSHLLCAYYCFSPRYKLVIISLRLLIFLMSLGYHFNLFLSFLFYNWFL